MNLFAMNKHISASTKSHWLFAVGFVLAASVLLADRTAVGERTALDRYVAAPDPHYRYELAKTIPGKGATTYVLDLTSQSWRTTNEVDRPVWRHCLSIIKPDTVRNTKSLLFIGGGSNDRPAPASPDSVLVQIAVGTQSIVSELRMVPNQPLTFKGEDKPRREDALIAYTWDKFLRTGDDTWPARLPMTKSAVRAMDTVVAFCDSPQGGMTKVDGFVVAGGSKRGWTTWTTAAVDRRVVAIIPVVIDVLNIEPSFKHHFEAYGFYAPAVHDYEEMHIMEWQGTPQYRALMKIVEPYEYRPRLTMPKFIINATGDQFFLPDSSRYYFDDLPGIKYLRYVPNADHSLKGSDGWLTLIACYQAVLTSAPLPKFSWTVQEGGALRVETVDKPEEVKLWHATNPNARDFRLETLGPVWTSSMLNDQGNGIYVAKVPAPAKGWTAFLVELTFANKGGLGPFKFTTGVQVVPDTVPHTFRPKAK
jgi:PhoPQ-activated pathogenicity-related protein